MGEEPKQGLNWSKLEKEFLGRLSPVQKPLADEHQPVSEQKVSSKPDYQIALENASKSMIRFKKPEHLIKMIVRMIDKQVGVTHTGVLLYKEDKNSYVLIDSKGEKGVKIPVGYIRLNPENPLIKAFTERQAVFLDKAGVLINSSIEEMLKDKDFLIKNPDLAKELIRIRRQTELLQANVCIPCFFKKRLLGVLILGNKLSGEGFTRDEIGFFQTLANDAAMAIINAQLIENLQAKIKEVEALYEKSHRLFINTSIALATAIDARDPYTHGHTERVTGYALAIADHMMDQDEVKNFPNFKESLHISALLHDIGKIGIPDSILNKRGGLTHEEYEKIKEHPVIGANILYPIRELGGILEGVRSHQERFDGSGYPDGLKGKQIPLLARIIAVADAFDAITLSRPYRDNKSIETAVEEIKRCSGTQFDPHVVEAFVKAYQSKKLSNHVS